MVLVKRKAKREAAVQLAQSCPEQMRALLAPHVSEYVTTLLDDLRTRTITVDGAQGPVEVNNPAHRTALELYPRIMRAIGASEDLLTALLERMNARDEATLGIAMGMYHAASSATLEDSERVAVQTIRGIVKASPWKRARLREACFGEREIEQGTMPVLTNWHHQEGRENGTVPRA